MKTKKERRNGRREGNEKKWIVLLKMTDINLKVN